MKKYLNLNRYNGILILFSFTLLVSSALLFWIQPLFTKSILPILGGSPSVWNTSMVCFQFLLLGGYWYADRLTKLHIPITQAIIHSIIVIIALSWVWVTSYNIEISSIAYKNPIAWQISILLTHIAIPFFLLATTSTLLQRWYAYLRPTDEVYWLYAISNFGSMLGVLGFIVIIEPFIGLTGQYYLFKWCFTILSVLLVFCSLYYGRRNTIYELPTIATTSLPSLKQKCRWILLSAVPSGLLLGATTHITMDIAPVPLIWMLLLALYLISFILAFSKWSRLSLASLLKIQMILCVPLLFEFFLDIVSSAGFAMMIWHLLAFFITALICHRLLYESRPPSEHLTTFYLYLSIGGVIGGIVTTFIAPLLFNSLLEYPLLFAASLALRPSVTPFNLTWRKDLSIGLAILIGLSLLFLSAHSLLNPFHKEITGVLLMLGIFIIKFCFDQKNNPLRLGLCYSAAILAGVVLADIRGKTLESERNFYGIVTIDSSDPKSFSMRHGTTTHGVQYIKGENHLIPLSYYHPSGPLGDLMKSLLEKNSNLNIAAIGLGVGSMACYGRKDDKISFFEINPAVVKLAKDNRYFSYLSDCKPNIEIITGDGRIKLDHEQQEFDLLIMDAFTSDAVPVHLLTLEAFNSYQKHLKAGGLIFVHISNRYLDLKRVLRAIANEKKLSIKIWEDKNTTQDPYKQASTWAVLGSNKAIEKLNLPAHWDNDSTSSKTYLWTDDYSNILFLIK